MINIILCGGNGTRFWPISRTLMPKQFVKLFDNESLFQRTIVRNSHVCSRQIIVSNSEQYFLATNQLDELKKIVKQPIGNKVRYILEPIGRNTAPATALACMACKKDDIVLVTPSDHLVKNDASYQEVVAKAKKLAELGHLVTFGIKPTFAEIGFGYIEANGENVKAFHEKPDKHTAENYLKNGNYYWNSGIFCFKAGVFLDELEKYSPNIYEAAKKAFQNVIEKDIITIKHEDMLSIPADSIDYAIMEKSFNVKVLASDIGWNDIGSFDALYSELPKDENGNTQNINHISIDSKNNLVYGKERKIATIDIEDCIIVDTGDALLISKKGSSQKVKEVVEQLKTVKSELPYIHLTGYRPWGTYTVLEDKPGYKIKRIEVKPGKRLSLQKHFHRNEHWVVVSGTATIMVGSTKRLIRPNEST
ncbi:mannose-1-phosphate guanylyltransferase/mannose-6-phosphate isomerase, partial [Sulfurospirillum cavolei]|uniref:mannose-1-phosphate guanylyltransferase/mannose-6-phosphate isomerase n=1 Tax=Sulfurospirillum cavolei TaxID=366522 RepID=UPI0005A71A44